MKINDSNRCTKSKVNNYYSSGLIDKKKNPGQKKNRH